jgi:AraC-like DNA-binding protein
MRTSFDIPALKLVLVAIERGLSEWDYPDCAAPFWRLYWNASGRGIVGYEGKRYALEGDSVLLIPPETAFSAHAETPMDHLYLHFLAGPPFEGAAPCVAASKASPAELAALRELAALAGGLPEGRRGEGAAPAGAPTRGLAARGGAPPPELALRAASLCYGRLALFPRSRLPASGEGGDLAARVAALVRRSPARPPSNGELARELGMSVPSLERAMRAQVGRSLHAYALWVRVGEACIMLRHTDASIDEIAETLGFSDRSHFSRTFSRLRGESPAAYRASSP